MDADVDAPPIKIVIAEGNEDITIKVSDEGGGIARSGLPKIWTYLYSTASSPLTQLTEDDIQNAPAVLAGYGYGLPLCRLYARYFGGELQVSRRGRRIGGSICRDGRWLTLSLSLSLSLPGSIYLSTCGKSKGDFYGGLRHGRVLAFKQAGHQRGAPTVRLNCALPLEPFLSYSCILYPPTQQQYRQQHHEARFPSEKKKKLKPKSGRSEPTRRIGQPRLRGRAPGNRHGEAEVLGSAAGEEETKEGPHNLQLPVLRGKEDGRSQAVSFFCPPPLPSAPQPAGRRSFTSFRAERQVLGLPSIDVADPSHPPQWRPAFAQLQNLCLLSLSLAGSTSLRLPP